MAKRDSAGVHVPPPLIYAAAFFAGVGLQKLTPELFLPSSLRGIGSVLTIAGLLLGAWSIGVFLVEDTTIFPHLPTTRIVARGPFRFVRNPMYVAMAVVYLGLDFYFRKVWPLAFLPIAIAVIHYTVILKEEAYLTRKFGESYIGYCAEVGRWLPKRKPNL